MPKGIPGPITWQVGRGLRIVAAHGPATGCAPRDFAGCEERGRGGRAAPSELAKRASSPPCRDGATSACTRMSTERTQWPARKRQQRTTGRIVLMQTSTAIQKGVLPRQMYASAWEAPLLPRRADRAKTWLLQIYTKSSAICTALVAAPLRIWSPQQKNVSELTPSGAERSRRMRPTKMRSWSLVSSGMG